MKGMKKINKCPLASWRYAWLASFDRSERTANTPALSAQTLFTFLGVTSKRSAAKPLQWPLPGHLWAEPCAGAWGAAAPLSLPTLREQAWHPISGGTPKPAERPGSTPERFPALRTGKALPGAGGHRGNTGQRRAELMLRVQDEAAPHTPTSLPGRLSPACARPAGPLRQAQCPVNTWLH